MGRGGKTERGRATRARVVAAATELLLERGYLDTTMASIADASGVSVQALYLAFGSKVAILTRAHDIAVVGDDVEVPLLDRPWVDELRAERDARRALRIAIANLCVTVEHTSPIVRVIEHAAADGDVADLLDAIREQRAATLRVIAEVVSEKRGFDRRVDPKRAADVLDGLLSNALHRLFVHERGWSRDEWLEFVFETAAAHLIARG